MNDNLSSYFSPVSPGIMIGRLNERIEPYSRQPDLDPYKFNRGIISEGMRPEPQVDISDIDIESVYSYALTNGLTSPDLTRFYNRYAAYRSLSPISQNLLILLYHNLTNYLRTPTANVNPLEEYIFSFDQSMEDDPLVRSIGARIGIGISPETYDPPYTVFIDKLVAYIQNVEHNRLNPANDLEAFPSTSEIIDMSRRQFDAYMKERGYSPDEGLYQDRLMVFLNLYLKSFILE